MTGARAICRNLCSAEATHALLHGWHSREMQRASVSATRI